MANLCNLSHIDFEDLCIDIIQKETGEKFSAFGAGPDGGIDGRHSKSEKLTVLQCKHYTKSSASELLRSARCEVSKLEKLKPTRYLFFTSHSLTPNLSDQLTDIFRPFIRSSNDIWGAEDIRNALRKHPDILKSHFKLWLTDSAILDRILHSGLENYTQITKDEITDESKVYVRNPSYDEAFLKLESKNTLIISGAPGVGKTTLAKMVCYQYLKDGWSFYAINSLEQGYAKINQGSQTVFFFDDFLGKIELNRNALVNNESALATFMKRVQKSENAKFILTTRSHIFEDARRFSESLDSQRFQLSKYILDVGLYTRKIRAHIFFNHISVSQLSTEHISALLKGEWLKKIIDHKNYNPRVISHLTSENIEPSAPDNYPESILSALDNPNSTWEKAFNTLAFNCQHLLITLYFCKEYLGAELEELRLRYVPLHRAVATRFSLPQKPTDFEDAIKILESGFISISGSRVDFVNPSVRDFLKRHLKDSELLRLVLSTSVDVNFALAVWHHLSKLSQMDIEALGQSARHFESLIPLILSSPTQKLVQMDGYKAYRNCDSGISERIKLLMELYECTQIESFYNATKSILISTNLDVDTSSDTRLLPEFHADLSVMEGLSEDQRIEMKRIIEDKIKSILHDGMHIEDLTYAIDYIHEFMTGSSLSELKTEIELAVASEIDNIESGYISLDDIDEIDLYIDNFKKITELTELNTTSVLSTLDTMAGEIEEQSYEQSGTSHQPSNRTHDEKFTDIDIKSLFYNLL